MKSQIALHSNHRVVAIPTQPRESAVCAKESQKACKLNPQAEEAIRCLREKMEHIRAQETKKAISKLEASSEKQNAVELLTYSIINEILHELATNLRMYEQTESQCLAADCVVQLFKL